MRELQSLAKLTELNGMPPTLREIAAESGVCVTRAHKAMKIAVAAGWVRKVRPHSGWILTETGKEAANEGIRDGSGTVPGTGGDIDSGVVSGGVCAGMDDTTVLKEIGDGKAVS